MAQEHNIKAIISAEDKTRAGVSSAQGNLGGLSETAKKLGGVLAGAFAVTKVIQFGKASFDAFVGAEAAMARVNTTLATMGPKGEAARGTIEALSKAALKLGFDDEDAAESVAKLFQRTGDLTEAQKLNALAMDLARAKSIDLGTATTLVGQVLSGNGKVLKQYGVEIDETKTPLEQLGELHTKVTGQAAAFADTTAGKMEVLKNSFGNLKETIGELLANGLTPILTWFGDMLNALPSLDEVRAGFENFFLELDAKTGLVTLLRDAWQMLVDMWTNQLKPALMELWVALQPYKPLLDALGKVFGTILVVAIGAFVMAVKGILGILMELLTVFTKVMTWISTNVAPIFDAIGKAIQGVVEWVEKLIDKIKQLNVLQGISNLAGKVTGKRAAGGPVAGGSSYLVGENGPELFTPSTFGRITPNGQLGGGGLTINLTGNTFLGKEDVARQIGGEILKALGLQTKINI